MKRICFTEDEKLMVDVILYNTFDKAIKDLTIAMQMIDAAEEVYAEGTLSIPETTINAGEHIEWQFVFDRNMIKNYWPEISDGAFTYEGSGQEA